MFIPLVAERMRKRFPAATVSLICLNILLFLVTIPLASDKFWHHWGLVPQLHSPFSINVVTSLLLHAGLLHVLLNMWFLWMYGGGVEDACGRVRLLLIYFLSGIAGQSVEAVLGSGGTAVGSGAAVSGIIGAYLVLFPRYRTSLLVFAGWMMRTAEVPAWCVAGLWGILETAYAAAIKGGAVEVAYSALLFGGVAGALLVLLAKRWLVVEKIQSRAKGDVSWLLRPTTGLVGRRRRRSGALFFGVRKEEMEEARRFVEGTHSPQAKVERLQKLMASGAGGAALEVWNSMKQDERHMVDHKTLKFLVREMRERGELEGAREAAQLLLAATPEGREKAEAFFLLGAVYEELGDYGAAIREYERAKVSGDERADAALERVKAKVAPRFLSPVQDGHKYAVVRADTNSTGGQVLIDIVAELTGGQKSDVARRIQVCGGIYAVGVDATTAKVMAEELSRLGVPSLVVDVDNVPPPPPPTTAVAAAFLPEGLLWSKKIEEDPALVPWERIIAINAGVIEHGTGSKQESRNASGRTEMPRCEESASQRPLMFALVDIILVKPYERLRIEEKRFSYGLVEARYGMSQRDFGLFLRRGIDLAPDTTVVSRGARIVARSEQAPIEHALIPTDKVLDLQGLWLAAIAYARRTAPTS